MSIKRTQKSEQRSSTGTQTTKQTQSVKEKSFNEQRSSIGNTRKFRNH
jgi:hypothetical protein